MKHILLLLVLFTGMLLLPIVAMAQAMPPPPMLPTDPNQAPLGGLGLLAAAGGAYAWKKLRSKSN